jgi:hypothetical protein
MRTRVLDEAAEQLLAEPLMLPIVGDGDRNLCVDGTGSPERSLTAPSNRACSWDEVTVAGFRSAACRAQTLWRAASSGFNPSD